MAPIKELPLPGRHWRSADLDRLRADLKRGARLSEIAKVLDRDALEIEGMIEQLAAEHQADAAHRG